MVGSGLKSGLESTIMRMMGMLHVIVVVVLVSVLYLYMRPSNER
jgi:hypothetical protein